MSELHETIRTWIGHRENSERLRLEQLHATESAQRLEPAVVGLVAEMGGELEVEIHGDTYTMSAELKLTQLAFSAAVKKRLYERQRGRCNAPRCDTAMETRHLEIDHIVPRSKGGQDVEDNLQLLCSWCNKVKGDRDMAYLETRLIEEGRAD